MRGNKTGAQASEKMNGLIWGASGYRKTPGLLAEAKENGVG